MHRFGNNLERVLVAASACTEMVEAMLVPNRLVYRRTDGRSVGWSGRINKHFEEILWYTLACTCTFYCSLATTPNYKLNDSPHPHVPLIFGLLKTNSADSLFSTKSISVPRSDSCAFLSIKIRAPSCNTSSSSLSVEQNFFDYVMRILNGFFRFEYYKKRFSSVFSSFFPYLLLWHILMCTIVHCILFV